MAQVSVSKIVGDKTKSIATIALTIIIGFAVLYVVWQIYKAIKTTKEIVGQEAGDVIIAANTGISTARLAFIRSVAQDLWDNATTRNWYTLGLVRDYDEEKYIAGINKMATAKEAAMLSKMYKTIHADGYDLKKVIEISFNDAEKQRLNSELYQAILAA